MTFERFSLVCSFTSCVRAIDKIPGSKSPSPRSDYGNCCATEPGCPYRTFITSGFPCVQPGAIETFFILHNSPSRTMSAL